MTALDERPHLSAKVRGALRQASLLGVALGVVVVVGCIFYRGQLHQGAASATTRVTLEMNATTGEVGEIFYAGGGQEYAAERSQHFAIARGWRTYRIDISSDQSLHRVRVDPGSGAGSVRFRRIALRQGDSEYTLLDRRRRATFVSSNRMEAVAGETGEVAFRATGEDPYLDFAVPAWFSASRTWRIWRTSILDGASWGALVFFSSLAVSWCFGRFPWLERRRVLASAWAKRRASPMWWWGCALLPPISGLLWARGHVLPTLMCASLTLSLITTLLAGGVAQRIVEGFRAAAPREEVGIFQLLWLGQYFVFALSIAITPFLALVADRTGWHLPLHMSIPALVGLAAMVSSRISRDGGPRMIWPAASSAPFAAVAMMGLYRAMHLHSLHAGALGHDTQQHIYWTQHLADYGFVAMTARGSDLIDLYPKFFHLLSACWSASGLTSIVGPYVKVMPSLQIVLACGFFAELLVTLLRARDASDRLPRSFMTAVMALFLVWHLTYGDGQLVYDGNDLSGTPRLAAACVVLGLPLLVLAARIGTLPSAGGWLLGVAIATPAFALGINPVVVPICFTYTLPVSALLSLFARTREATRPRIAWFKTLAWSSFAVLALLLSNALVIEMMIRSSAGAKLLGAFGIRASVAGVAAPSVIADAPPPLCRESAVRCATELIQDASIQGVEHFRESVLHAEMAGFGAGSYAYVYWLIFSAPLLYLALRATTGEVSVPRRGARIFLAILAASAIPSVLHPVVSALLAKLAIQSWDLRLLHAYYASLKMFLGAWLRCLLPLSSWALLPLAPVSPRAVRLTWACAGAAALFAMTAFGIPSLADQRNAKRPWTIDWPELRALRHASNFVSPQETVVVPASHITMGAEHILMAPDPAGIAAVHLKTKLLFLVRLGSGRDYGWKDLSDTFCGAEEDRRALLRRVNARWVFVRDPEPRSTQLLRRRLWRCATTLEDLNAEYPPAWSERDLALYRINP